MEKVFKILLTFCTFLVPYRIHRMTTAFIWKPIKFGDLLTFLTGCCPAQLNGGIGWVPLCCYIKICWNTSHIFNTELSNLVFSILDYKLSLQQHTTVNLEPDSRCVFYDDIIFLDLTSTGVVCERLQLRHFLGIIVRIWGDRRVTTFLNQLISVPQNLRSVLNSLDLDIQSKNQYSIQNWFTELTKQYLTTTFLSYQKTQFMSLQLLEKYVFLLLQKLLHFTSSSLLHYEYKTMEMQIWIIICIHVNPFIMLLTNKVSLLSVWPLTRTDVINGEISAFWR